MKYPDLLVERSKLTSSHTIPQDKGLGGCLLSYILDLLGDTAFPNAGTAPGDLNNDNEVNIGDVNEFVDYVLKCNSGEREPLYSHTGLKHIQLCLSASDLSPLVLPKESLDKLFVVRVEATCSGDMSAVAELGCRWDEDSITGLAYNSKPLYDAAIKYANAYGDSCDNNDASAFVDFLMRYYGFVFALKCGDICQAKYYWDNYLNGGVTGKTRSFKPCGCHGRYY